MYAKGSVHIPVHTAVKLAPINGVVSKSDTVFLIVQYVTDTDGRPIGSITAISYDANCSDPIQRCPLDKMNFVETVSIVKLSRYFYRPLSFFPISEFCGLRFLFYHY